jgi:SAM-dependent methyltransferase
MNLPLKSVRARLSAALLALFAAGAARAQDEVPFITTPDNVTLAMLELAGVSAGDHVLDLGSGDGRIVITAVKRFGASGLGVEIVPELVRKSRESAIKAGVAARAEFREQDLFATDLGSASVITMYLLPEVNLQLRPRLLALAPGTRIVSHDWDMGEWLPERTLTIDAPDKSIGREKKSKVHLWIVPARVAGLWCAGPVSLELVQRFQNVSGTLARRGDLAPLLVFDARALGAHLRAEGAPKPLALRAEAGALVVEQMAAGMDIPAGRRFVRAGAAGCP